MVLVIFLVCITLAMFFAVQNSAPVTVSLLIWKFDASLSIVILLSVLAGAVMASLLFISGMLRRKMKKREENQGIPPAGA